MGVCAGNATGGSQHGFPVARSGCWQQRRRRGEVGGAVGRCAAGVINAARYGREGVALGQARAVR
eukprot:8677870-Alexandrium_andersonii.AAC.1